MITIYGKPDCPYCEKAKSLASDTGQSFTYINLNHDPMALVSIKADGFTTVPAIYEDSKKIGGYTEFELHMES